jgi:succinyl-CoA synthetase alpha subunit
VPQEELPGIQPLLFRELDHRIAQTRLQHQPLPDAFLTCEDGEAGGSLVFQGERYDLNITLFAPRTELESSGGKSGVFVVSNGAGVLTNTVDELSRSVSIAGMIDLKQDFSEAKITAAFEMARATRPQLDALVINMISGIALARDAAAAIERFCTSVEGKVPIILRFSGPDPGDNQAILRTLAQRRDSVTLAHSTRDLVDKTVGLFGLAPAATLTTASMTERVHAALEDRARLGVTVDPRTWLTPDRTIENVFGSKADTRIGVLGFGETSRFQTRAMKDAGVRICWVVTPTAAKHADSGIPDLEVFATVKEAVAARGDVDLVINYAPPAKAFEAAHSCLQDTSRTTLMIVVAEDMPYEKAIRVMDILDESGTACVGPNSPGVMIVEEREGRPDLFKLGNMPASIFTTFGGMSVVGRSGTVIFDIVEQAAAAGIGTRLAWAIGGNKYTGLGFLESLVVLEQDPATRFIVLNGESGGIQEQLAARLVATGIISKPVIALVTGEALPAGVEYGHQGAVKFAEADDPRIKKQHLAAAGAIVVDNPTEVVQAIQEIERLGWNLEVRRREALWKRLIHAGKADGLRWHENLRAPYDLLYDLVGHYRIFNAHEQTAHHLHELMTHLLTVGIDRFVELLSTTLHPDAFVMAFEKSREYTAELIRSIHEIGIENFRDLVTTVFGEDPFNRALAATPWAAADLINEAHEIGIPETQNVVAKTMGTALFRETLASKPWNTAHAFRSINNMRWWCYVRAYDRCCTHLAGDNQLPKAAWRSNPWASVKLVRFYERMPDGGLERALEDPDSWALFSEKSPSDPQGLLDLETRALWESVGSERTFHEVFREQVRKGVPGRPKIEAEIQRMGTDDFQALIDTVFTREAFERSRRDHEDSTARALKIINDLGDAHASGAQQIIAIYRNHLEAFDTPAFRLGVARNLWMVVDLLRAMGQIDAISAHRIIDYVISQTTFNYAVGEHQWGTAQAFHKIGDMGPKRFLDTHRILEDVTRDRECFGASFKKNPRDAVEIVQVAARLGTEALSQFMADLETREAFLTRMRVCPRNAAHFLAEVAVMGVGAFNDLVDRDFGRSLLNEMLRFKGCNLVRSMRRINIVGVDAFRRELRAWKAEDPARLLTPQNATDIVGILKERALERRFTDPERVIQVNLQGQPAYRVSEGEVRGLYRSYPEWGDVLFKLEGGLPMTPAERVDLYRLVSGRKRFQRHMVTILTNFVPLRSIRSRITKGEPLIQEIRALRSVTQRPPHRFDVYFHTLEVLDQLEKNVLPLDFLPDVVQQRVRRALDEEIEHVSRQDLLVLAAALHDLGKVDGGSEESAGHVARSVKAAEPILERFGLTEAQKALVLAVIRYHAPAKIRKPGESWEDFERRGGLDLLYEEIEDDGRNPYPIETILHYHADILGRQGQETSRTQVERRKRVTGFLLERYMREHPEPVRPSSPEPPAASPAPVELDPE